MNRRGFLTALFGMPLAFLKGWKDNWFILSRPGSISHKWKTYKIGFRVDKSLISEGMTNFKDIFGGPGT